MIVFVFDVLNHVRRNFFRHRFPSDHNCNAYNVNLQGEKIDRKVVEGFFRWLKTNFDFIYIRKF